MDAEDIIALALREDIGDGDHTTLATVPAGTSGRALLKIKERGVLCGVKVAREVFRQADSFLEVRIFLDDGQEIYPGDIVLEVRGEMASILRAERVVLNFMQRLSGIATATRMVARMLEGTHTRLLDTRKTTPGMRILEKYAVAAGGGINHRMGLYDMILIKDNHVDVAGGISEALSRSRTYLQESGRDLEVEIEVRNMDELEEALNHGGAGRIMLDNFSPVMLKEAVKRIAGRVISEASGGIHLHNLPDYIASGVDYISMGALTHHVKSLDMSLKVVRDKEPHAA